MKQKTDVDPAVIAAAAFVIGAVILAMVIVLFIEPRPTSTANSESTTRSSTPVFLRIPIAVPRRRRPGLSCDKIALRRSHTRRVRRATSKDSGMLYCGSERQKQRRSRVHPAHAGIVP